MAAYVLEVSRVTCPPLSREPRILAVIRAFCDESYDSASRIYTIGGFVARDKQWANLARNWKNRCLRDGIQCYHAADCEGGYGDFAHLSNEQIIELNTDLVDRILAVQIVGFATSLVLEDYRKVSQSSDKARKYLGTFPYFMVMQTFLVSLCGEVYDSRPEYRIAFIFDQQEEFSGRAKQLYDEVKLKNPNIARCMGTLAYEDKQRFVPLQVADKLAYEAMKDMLNRRYDPERRERVSLTRMKPRIQTLNYLDEQALNTFVDAQP